MKDIGREKRTARFGGAKPGAALLGILLAGFSVTAWADEDGCPCGDQDETVTASIEGRSEVTGTMVIEMLDHSGSVVRTVNVVAPTGGGPMDGTVEIPVPWGDQAAGVRFSGPGSAGNNFGLRVNPGLLIWRTTEGDATQGATVGRPGDWLGKGSQWWVKRQYPFPNVTGESGPFETGVPRLTVPSYTEYGVQRYAGLFWLLRFGAGGSLELSGDLYGGSTLHQGTVLRFWPAPNTSSASHAGSGYQQYVFAQPGASSPLYVAHVVLLTSSYTISIYDGALLTGMGPFGSLDPQTLLETFTVSAVTPAGGYNYGVQITKDNGQTSTFYGGDDSSPEQDQGFEALAVHDTGSGSNQRLEEVECYFPEASVRGLSRRTWEDPALGTLSEVTEEFEIGGGIERKLNRVETVGSGADTRETRYEYHGIGSGPSSGKLRKVEHFHAGTLAGWRAYAYEIPATGVYRVHEFAPWEDTPAAVPGTLDPGSFSGRVVTRDYHEAASTVPRRIKQETTKINGIVTGDVHHFYDTVSDGVSGVTFDRHEELQYTSAAAYLRTYQVTWPRQPASTYRHWALAPRYTQAPDNTKQRQSYSGGGASSTVTSVWNEPLTSGKTRRTATTVDVSGRTARVQTDLYIGSTWHDAVTWTNYTFGKPGWRVQAITDNRVVEELAYPADGQVDSSGRDGIWERRKHDRFGRVIEEKRDAGGGVAEITTAIAYSGLTTTRTRTGGGLSMSSTTSSDRLGRMTLSVDEQGLSTAYTYAALGPGMRTTETLPGGTTRITDRCLDGQIRSVTGTAGIAQYYNYEAEAGTGQIYTIACAGTSGNERRETVYRDWAGRTAKTVKPGATGSVTSVFGYYTNGTNGGGGRLQSIESTGDAILGRQVYDYDPNGELLNSGVEEDGAGGDGAPTPASLEELTRQETSYVQAGAGSYWRRTESWVYDEPSSAHLRKASMSAERIGGDAYVRQSYAVDYTDNNGAYGVVTARKEMVLSRSSATGKVETVQWDLAGFNPVTFAGTVQIGQTAVQEYTHGYLQRESSFTVTAWTTYDYDDLGRLTHQSNSRTGGNTVTAYWHEEADAGRYKGKVKSVTDPLGAATLYSYCTGETGQPAGALKATRNAASKHTRYQYNERGQLTHVWGDTGYPVRYQYDGTYGDRTHMWTYKAGSNWTGGTWPSATTGPADETVWTWHAASGLLTATTDGLGRAVSYAYHAGTGLVSRRTWARGVYTDYTYHWTGKLTQEDHSDATPDVLYAYDRLGRVQTLNDDAGQHAFTDSFASGNRTSTETVTVSSGGNRTSVLAGTVAATVADKWGRRTNLDANRSGAVLADLGYTYQSGTARLEEVTATYPAAGDHSGKYTYAPGSDLIASAEHRAAGATKLTQTRSWNNAVDRLETVGNSVSAGTVSSHAYLYDNLHRRTKATTEDGTYWDYAYNDRGEVTGGTKKLSTGAAISSWSFYYGYDNIGNRTSFYGDGDWASYSSYNGLNQPGAIGGGAAYTVKGRTESTGSPAVSVDGAGQTVTTQAAGTKKYFKASVTAPSTPDYQWVNITEGTQGSAYYKFVPPASYGPQYDLDGNLTEDDRWVYTWDANNRLTRMQTRVAAVYAGTPNLNLEFKYDAFGRRIEKRKIWVDYGNSVEYTEIYVYDGWNPIARVRNGALNQSYAWGLDLSGSMQGAGGIGGLLMIYTASGGAVHFPAYDGNGNVMSLVNVSSLAVEADYAYDPFGVLQRIRGITNVEWDNPFRFSTKYTDDESGHLYYGYRYLDPRHSRWLGRDPIGEAGGLNLYGFVGNDGVNRDDAFGLVSSGGWPNLSGWSSLAGPPQTVMTEQQRRGRLWADGFTAAIQLRLNAQKDYFKVIGMDNAVDQVFEYGLPTHIYPIAGGDGELGAYRFPSNTMYLTQFTTVASFLHEMVHYWMDMRHALNLRSRRHHEGVAWLMQHYYESGKVWAHTVGRVTSFSYGDDCKTIERKLMLAWPRFWTDYHSPDVLTGTVTWPIVSGLGGLISEEWAADDFNLNGGDVENVDKLFGARISCKALAKHVNDTIQPVCPRLCVVCSDSNRQPLQSHYVRIGPRIEIHSAFE